MQHSFKFIHKVVIVIVIMIVVTLGLYVMRQTQGFVNNVNLPLFVKYTENSHNDHIDMV